MGVMISCSMVSDVCRRCRPRSAVGLSDPDGPMEGPWGRRRVLYGTAYQSKTDTGQSRDLSSPVVSYRAKSRFRRKPVGARSGACISLHSGGNGDGPPSPDPGAKPCVVIFTEKSACGKTTKQHRACQLHGWSFSSKKHLKKLVGSNKACQFVGGH